MEPRGLRAPLLPAAAAGRKGHLSLGFRACSFARRLHRCCTGSASTLQRRRGCAKLLGSEGFHLALVFVIGSLYTYGPLMTYPLYKQVVEARSEKEATPEVVGILLVVSKMTAMAVHALGVRVCDGDLRWMQAFVVLLFAACTLCVVFAASSGTSQIGVLLSICSMNLVSSRVLGGTLFAVPREDAIRVRTFAYDMSAQVGCLWISLVARLLQRDCVRASDAMRFAVLMLPLGVCIMAWLAISPVSFFSPTRMALAQGAGRARSAPNTPKAASQAEGASPGEDALRRRGGGGGAAEVARVPMPEPATQQQGSPWRDPRFRVLAVTCWMNYWSYNFFGYTAFPGIIAETGHSIEMVSALYTIEGLSYSALIILLFPYFRSMSPFLQYFGAAWMVTILPPLAVCVFGRIHWTGFLIALFWMDIFSAVNNAVTGVVLLRCLPWDLIPLFYSQAGMLGGWVCALSFIQLCLYERFGWPAASLLGHGSVLCMTALVYVTHRRALVEIWEGTKDAQAPQSD